VVVIRDRIIIRFLEYDENEHFYSFFQRIYTRFFTESVREGRKMGVFHSQLGIRIFIETHPVFRPFLCVKTRYRKLLSAWLVHLLDIRARRTLPDLFQVNVKKLKLYTYSSVYLLTLIMSIFRKNKIIIF